MVPQPDVETDGAPNCVLVVDDDAVIRLILAEAIRDAGWRVIEARSGADALSYLRSDSHVDIIFSDIQMPGSMDGLQLARHVRATYPTIPVILTSGKVAPAHLDVSGNFIAKPYRVDRVVALIAQILSTPDKAAK
jgi:CheY-like chemotaxis protein